MASIGGNTVLFLKGVVAPKGESLEEVTRPGVSGHSFSKMGERSSVITVETLIDLTSASARNTMITTYRALVGTAVTVVDDFSKSTTGVIVHDVQEISSKMGASAVGGINGGKVLLHCRWRLQLP